MKLFALNALVSVRNNGTAFFSSLPLSLLPFLSTFLRATSIKHLSTLPLQSSMAHSHLGQIHTQMSIPTHGPDRIDAHTHKRNEIYFTIHTQTLIVILLWSNMHIYSSLLRSSSIICLPLHHTHTHTHTHTCSLALIKVNARLLQSGC